MEKIVIPQAAIDEYNKKYADKIAKYKASIPSDIPYYLDEDAIYEKYLKDIKEN